MDLPPAADEASDRGGIDDHGGTTYCGVLGPDEISLKVATYSICSRLPSLEDRILAVLVADRSFEGLTAAAVQRLLEPEHGEH